VNIVRTVRRSWKSGYGSGRSSAALVALKIAVVAAMRGPACRPRSA
jgi:hypothetical protein